MGEKVEPIGAEREDASPSYGAPLISQSHQVITPGDFPAWQKEGLISQAWKVLMKWSEGARGSIIQLEGDVFGDKILMEPLPTNQPTLPGGC